ncbi:MAG: DUF502 domain-containing protein [Chlamydiales bacterium]|nr:DUF502 domain-containing protein [Chlamydiales bacterium]
MKKHFWTGLVTLLPIALTLVISLWLFNLFTTPLAGLMEKIILVYEKKAHLNLESHQDLVLFLSRLLALLVLIALIFLLGFLGRKFFIHFFLNLTDKLLRKIPFIRGIYRITNEIVGSLFSDTQKTFKKTVLVPFPHQEAHAIGFLTGETPSLFKEKTNTDFTIFVPTSPHPMSGFVLLVPKKIVIPVDVPIEDAFKFIISCGVIHPGDPPPKKE